MDPRFAHIREWIFDLDNCLYPASTGLFELIDRRMGAYIQRLLDCDPTEARRVQKAHFHAHGTTLAGLMKEHDVDPHDFLDDVHAVELDRVQCDSRLARLLPRLPGRRFVFTNGDASYARRVLAKIGLETHFDDLHDIHASSYRPKPDPYGYALLCERFGPLTFAMALVMDGPRMRLVLRRWTVLGMPLPMWLCPRSDSYETAKDGQFRFHVEIGHRLTGLIVRYQGWLEPR